MRGSDNLTRINPCKSLKWIGKCQAKRAKLVCADFYLNYNRSNTIPSKVFRE